MTSNSNLEIAIGIDLGTTYSCVGVFKDGKIEILANDQGNRVTPSYVAFTEEERLIGNSAKNQANYNPTNTIYDAKRLIGRSFHDKVVQQDMKQWSFTVVDSDHNTHKPTIKVNYKNKEHLFTPEEISAMILTKMKEIAEAYLDYPVTKAVITVPAYFNDKQRRATKDAGVIAGLEVLRIINEPTAAALAYGLNKQNECNVLIFDLGGGTFDVSLLTIADGVFEVRATAGNTHLGGEDFDGKLVTWCLKEIKRKYKFIDIKSLIQNSKILRKLKTSCERAKRALSSASSAWIEIDSLTSDIDFRCQITRAKFENLCHEDFMKCLDPIDKVLKDAQMSKEKVDEIVLVGGSTRIPKIREMIKNYFNGKEPKKDINPDEAVAYGAAVQAAILSNIQDEKLSSLVLVDVTPLSLGIETHGGIMAKLVTRNTTIPCTKERTFSTYTDNQPGVTVKIYEGEREFTEHNNLLGTFELVGIPPMPRGVPKIIVKFKIDVNGIMQVTATEESTNTTHKITIRNDKNRFTDDQLSHMIEQAEKFSEQDKQIREKLESRNQLESYLYKVRNSIIDEELKNRLGENNYKIITDVIIKGIQWVDDNEDLSKEEYNAKLKEYENIVAPILTKAYKQSNDENKNNEQDKS